MEIINSISHNLLSFILIISLIVFIHEFGHYYVARLCGVKIEEFAIGFGREIFGFFDKNKTRWKFCLLPFGGYVKMFGDRNPASVADQKKIKNFTEEEKRQSFYFQNVYKRIAIVAAGPIANFILAIFLFTVIFNIRGVNTVLPIVDELTKDGAAMRAGIIKGDEILEIDGSEIKDFTDLRSIISGSADKKLKLKIRRNQEELELFVTPQFKTITDFFGDEIKIGMIGISSNQVRSEKLNIFNAFLYANIETYKMSKAVLVAMYDLATGKRSIKELGGPVKIAQYSGKSVDMGIMVVLWFMAMISINLGVLNFLPIPILDGGHLFYYIIEAIRKKPLPEKIQQFGFQLGFGIVITLMIFTTLNDFYQLFN